MNITPEDVDDVLPQTQCRQCGCDGCLAYAREIVLNDAPINRCAPGGKLGIERLAAATLRPVIPLDPEYGHEMPFATARIRAKDCIGCGWCVKVCPTDAIAGSPKHLYGVVEADCTGCALCLDACPMDCIDMIESKHVWSLGDAHRARSLFIRARQRRLRAEAEEDARLDALRNPAPGKEKSAIVEDVLAKVRAKKEEAK
jgi:electron transport complex protein RnfB